MGVFDWLRAGWWPFGQIEPSGDYSRDLTLALQRYASNDSEDADPELASAVGTAATWYGVALAGARVEGAGPAVTEALSPQILGWVGRQYPSRGMATLLADVDQGDGLRLTPCRVIEHRAGRLHTRRRNGDRLLDRWVEPSEVVHVVFEPSDDPLIGLPPWLRSPHLAQACANVERSLAREGGMPVGSLLSTAGDTTGDATEDSRRGVVADLNRATGQVVPLPAQHDRGLMAPPGTTSPPSQREGRLTRLGMEFSPATPQVAAGLGQTMLAALGIPPAMMEPNVAGGVFREARRFWQRTSLPPIAAAVQAELRAKLEQPGLTLELSAEGSLEEATLARAAGSRANAAATFAGIEGVSTADALRWAGVEA